MRESMVGVFRGPCQGAWPAAGCARSGRGRHTPGAEAPVLWLAVEGQGWSLGVPRGKRNSNSNGNGNSDNNGKGNSNGNSNGNDNGKGNSNSNDNGKGNSNGNSNCNGNSQYRGLSAAALRAFGRDDVLLGKVW